MRVVAFTGMPGAGKSEAVDEARKRGIPIVNMGDFVREEAQRQGLPATDTNLGDVATRMRKQQGADVWAARTCDRIESEHRSTHVVVIDGVRTLDEIRTFRRRLGEAFHLVAIEAPTEVRIDRLRKRARSDDPQRPEDLARRDAREIGWGILDAIRSADERIENVPPLDGFRAQVARLLERLTAKA